MKKRISFLLALILVLAVMVPAIPVSAAENGVATMTELYDGGGFNSTLYATTNKFTISNVDEFELFYDAICGGGDDYLVSGTSDTRNMFEGKTVTLENDIVLNDTSAADWYSNVEALKFIQYCDYGAGEYGYFTGDFDGQGHTIKGLIIEGGSGWDWASSVGLFTGARRAVIKNFTLDGFYITADGASEVGIIVGRADSGCEISGVTIKNGSLTAVNCTVNKNPTPLNWSGVGGLFGMLRMEIGASDGNRSAGFSRKMTVSNCVIEDTVSISGSGTVEGLGDVPVGGIVGYFYTNDTISEATVDVTASKITPNGSTDSTVTLKPFGYAYFGFELENQRSLTLTFKNDSHSYSETITVPNINSDDSGIYKIYTTSFSDKILASKSYGSRYEAPAVFTVTWIVDGKETTQTYNKGATPSYPGSTNKASTDTTIYEFDRWTPEISQVTENVTYTAKYREYKKITVKWVVDGVETVEYYKEHDIPVPKVDTDKAQDEDYVYTFEGWDRTIATATEDVTYTAVYSKLAKCEVTWIIDGKEIKEMYLEGAVPAYKGKPEKEEDADYTYKFKGWDVQPSALTGDVTYTAQFEAKAKNPVVEEEAAGCKGTVTAGLVTVMVVGMAGAFLSRKKDD